MPEKVSKSDEEWRRILTPEQDEITQKRGTAPSFTGKYYSFKGKGVYKCVRCGNDLFSPETKYDSGTGWPSFWAPISDRSNQEALIRLQNLTEQCVTAGAAAFEANIQQYHDSPETIEFALTEKFA